MNRFTQTGRAAGAACIAGLCCLSGLAGCQQAYEVDLINGAPQPVFVELIVLYPNGQVAVHQAGRLGPGDRGELGPVRTNVDNRVSFRADTLPNTQRPLRLDLRPGQTRLRLEQPGDRTAGPLMVSERP